MEFIGVKVRDPKVKVIDGSRLTFALLNAKERRSHTPRMRTGRTFDNRWVMAFSVRDGRIAKFDEYADTQALAAANDASYRDAPWMHST